VHYCILKKKRYIISLMARKVVFGSMADRKTISTEKAPAAIGSYAQANLAGGFVFVSGQIPLDPVTGGMAEGGIAVQAERALENLKAILEASGSGLGGVVKTTVFLADMDDFAKMNEVYARYFAGGMLPSRSAVQVAALPKGALVEIEAIAIVE
jgi:2-iminobutanoate/2-iminopropanoate deaminase